MATTSNQFRKLLNRVLARLREECAGPGGAGLFEALQPFLAAKEGGESYAAAAGRLGCSEETIKKAVRRMRRRYQELLCEEIARSITPEEVEDEVRHLRQVLRNG